MLTLNTCNELSEVCEGQISTSFYFDTILHGQVTLNVKYDLNSGERFQGSILVPWSAKIVLKHQDAITEDWAWCLMLITLIRLARTKSLGKATLGVGSLSHCDPLYGDWDNGHRVGSEGWMFLEITESITSYTYSYISYQLWPHHI